MRQGQEEARAGQRWGQGMVGWKTGDGHSQAPDQHSGAYRALHIRGLACVCRVYAGPPGRRRVRKTRFCPVPCGCLFRVLVAICLEPWPLTAGQPSCTYYCAAEEIDTDAYCVPWAGVTWVPASR